MLRLLQPPTTFCNEVSRITSCYNTLQHIEAHSNTFSCISLRQYITLQLNRTHHNTAHQSFSSNKTANWWRTAPHSAAACADWWFEQNGELMTAYNTFQHNPTHSDTFQHIPNTFQHISLHRYSTIQFNTTHHNTAPPSAVVCAGRAQREDRCAAQRGPARCSPLGCEGIFWKAFVISCYINLISNLFK